MRIGLPLKLALPFAVALSLALASTSSAATTPPFQQCPAVGYDTSCQLLIHVDSTGTANVLTDPTQGAFDGVEDTLIGVQNDAAVTLNSITVTSTSRPPPFGFEGDGACSGTNSNPGLGGTFAPPPAGCPFGSTGYEGPGVSYTALSADQSTGTVNFANGIPPGGTSWFSLEGPVSANSVTIPPPPMVTIAAPFNGGVYPVGYKQNAVYTCVDGPGAPGLLPGSAGCSGPIPNGTPIDFSTPGSYCFMVTATSKDGESASAKSCYRVAAPPTVTITTPADGAAYQQGSTVNANYTCANGAGGSGVASCVGPVPNGSPIDTSTLGRRCFTVNAESNDGFTAVATNCYTVVAPTYTGDAYNLRASASLLGVVKLPSTTINEVGPISTMAATNNSNTILTESVPLLGLSGSQLSSSVVTGNYLSTAKSSTHGLTLGLPLVGVPVISTGEVQASSQTACTVSTGALRSTPRVTIASLKIGTRTVNIPSPIPANDTISLGPLGSVTLNEQQTIKDGLSVNAIDIKLLTNLGLGTVQVIIGHAESDLDGC